jgi:hypothetical protein
MIEKDTGILIGDTCKLSDLLLYLYNEFDESGDIDIKFEIHGEDSKAIQIYKYNKNKLILDVIKDINDIY